jgi:hypothetical protein
MVELSPSRKHTLHASSTPRNDARSPPPKVLSPLAAMLPMHLQKHRPRRCHSTQRLTANSETGWWVNCMGRPPIPKGHAIPIHEALQGHPDLSAPRGATDSTWGADRSHRRSVGGIVFPCAGSAARYKCRHLPAIALSSTEAKFASMADAGKAALCLRSPLSDAGFEQNFPTEMLADNRGAMQMANAQQPTRQTWHVDMKQFVILQWSKQDPISFTDCPPALLMADSMTKQSGRTKFHEHFDIVMGRRRPNFSMTNPAECEINVVSASNNLRLLRLDKIVSSLVG